MNPQHRNRPLVRVYDQGCDRKLPKDRYSVNVGTWNVRTLKEEQKLYQLLSEMSRLRLDILGIAETHWNSETPESWEENGCVIFSSSRRDQIHR